MAEAAVRMRALLAQSLRASEPQRSVAEQDLQQLQQSPLAAPFLAALLELSVAVPGADGEPANLAVLREVDDDTRLLACLWLKHYLKKQWKSKANDLGDAERAHVRRALLFAALREPNETIALHLALVLAQMARGDFPAQWRMDELFPPMLRVLQQSVAGAEAIDVLAEKRHVDVTYRIVKELATRRLMVHRKQFAALSIELLPLMMQYWKVSASRTMELLWAHCQSLAQATDPAAATQVMAAMGSAGVDRLALTLRTVKLLSTVLLNAYRDLAGLKNGELIRQTLVEFYNQLENMAKLRQALAASAGGSNHGGFVSDSDQGPLFQVVIRLDKCMHRTAAIVVGLQNSYPIEFREYLSPFLAIFWQVLTSCAPVGLASSSPATFPAPERLQIAALQFFANVLGCRLYKNESLTSAMGSSRIISKVITASGDVELSDTMVLEAQSAVESFFSAPSENRFESLLTLVVKQYMTLHAKDLEEWQIDPEGYCNAAESMTAEESVRACAENLFLTLLQNFPQQTIPVLTQMASVASSCLQEIGRQGARVADEQRIIDTDAVLLALGLGCYDLHECFEFEPWFLTNLVPILAGQDVSIGCIRGLPVLRFRIVWLVSCWLAQLSANVRPPLYNVILSPTIFLPDADAALKLRVVQTLESMVNDWGFESDAFAPFVARALHCLFSFFPQTDETDSKMKILSCVESMVQACGAGIVSFCETIASPLPSMWSEEGESSNLVRGKILQLLAKLLATINCDEAQGNSSLTSAAGSTSVQALVGMCIQVVRFATDVSNPDEVFLMESGLELWRSTLDVAPSYTEELHLLFNNAIRLLERDYEHIKVVLEILEHYVRKGGAQFWEIHHQAVAGMLTNVVGNVRAEASHQIAEVMELVIAVFPVEQLACCFPVVKAMISACDAFRRKESQCEPDGVIASYLSVVALLLVRNFDVSLAHAFDNDQSALLMVVEAMLHVYYTVGSSPLTSTRRKVWALALCASLSLVSEPMLEKTGEILEVCVDVIDTEREDAQDASGSNADDQEGGGGVFRAYQAHRSQQQRAQSEVEAAVRSVDVKGVACARLSIITQQIGSQSAFDMLLATVDSSVLHKLQS